ncbi:hypothetical protein B0F90DRAFT_1684426, partial [Multifurca ochricompacta]
MPLRSYPKIFQVLVKTHKLTVFLALPNETAISVVKEQVLSAFSDDVLRGIHDLPNICSLEISRKGISSYEVLTDDQLLRDVAGNWTILFIQFKDASGQIQPVEVIIPSLTDDDEDVSGSQSASVDPVMDVDETFERVALERVKGRQRTNVIGS